MIYLGNRMPMILLYSFRALTISLLITYISSQKENERINHGNYASTFQNLTDTSHKDSITNETVDTYVKHVDIEASVDASKWHNYLQSKFLKRVSKAAKKGMPPGTYKVSVRFLVEKDGSINFTEVIDDPGYGLGDDLVDIIKSGPKWKPGYRDGKPLRSYHTQPVTFVINKK